MSAHFNRVERNFAQSLNRFPFLKRIMKASYQFISFYLYRKPYQYEVLDNIPLSSSNGLSFGGYYDKLLKNKNGIVYHSIEKEKSKITNYKIRINYNSKSIADTRSWNWQQGAMLQFFSDSKIIYNDFENGKYISIIMDISTFKKIKLDMPVYTLSPDRSFALSLNFNRLAKLRPDYGYFNFLDRQIKFDDKSDGIFKMDLKENKSELIISIDQLKKFKPRPEMNRAVHKVNHLMIAPGGQRFMFLHRWFTPKGLKFSRLITADKNGKTLFLLADNEMVSHCNWKNKQEIIGWMRMDEGDHYYCLKDLTNERNIIGEDVLNEDGHPGISKDEQWMLTDTYPDKARMSHLLLFNLKTEKLIKLGAFYSPLKYHDFNRCDLHPRFSFDGKSISFDSVHNGIRNMYVMDISKILNDNA